MGSLKDKIVEAVKSAFTKKEEITKIETPTNSIYVNGEEGHFTFTITMPYVLDKPMHIEMQRLPEWDDPWPTTTTLGLMAAWNQTKLINTPLLSMADMKPYDKWAPVRRQMSEEMELMWGPTYKIEVGKAVYESHKEYLGSVTRIMDRWASRK